MNTVLQDMIMEQRAQVPAQFGAPTVGSLDARDGVVLLGGCAATIGGGYLCYQKWHGTGLIIYALLGAPFAFFAGALVIATVMPRKTS